MNVVITTAVGNIEFVAGNSYALRLTTDFDLTVNLVGGKRNPVNFPFHLVAAVNSSGIGSYVSVGLIKSDISRIRHGYGGDKRLVKSVEHMNIPRPVHHEPEFTFIEGQVVTCVPYSLYHSGIH